MTGGAELLQASAGSESLVPGCRMKLPFSKRTWSQTGKG
jgi:hypothetical protein